MSDLLFLLDDLGLRAYTFVLFFTVHRGLEAFRNSHRKVYGLSGRILTGDKACNSVLFSTNVRVVIKNTNLVLIFRFSESFETIL